MAKFDVDKLRKDALKLMPDTTGNEWVVDRGPSLVHETVMLPSVCGFTNYEAESPYGEAAGLSGDCVGRSPEQASATQPL